MSPKAKKILQVILSVLMIVSVFLPWYNYHASYNVNVAGYSIGANTGDISISGGDIGQNWLMVLISIVAIVLSFTKFKFTFILGIMNLCLTIVSILFWKHGTDGLNYSVSGAGVSASAGLTNSFGPYVLMTSSVIFSFISFNLKELLGAKDDKNTTPFEDSNVLSQVKETKFVKNETIPTANKLEDQTCPNCKTVFPANAKFCPNCGNQANQDKFCNDCGTKVTASIKFCPNCGKVIVPNTGVAKKLEINPDDI